MLSLTLLLGFSAWSQESVRVVRHERIANGARVVLSLPEPTLESVTASDGQTYARLSVKGAGVAAEYGRPALPVIQHTCEVPLGMECEVTVQEMEYREVRSAHPLWPHQPPTSKAAPQNATQPFLVSHDAYFGARSMGFQRAGSAKPRIIHYRKRGRDYAEISLQPFAYHAAKGTIRYPRQVVLEVAFTEPLLPAAAGPRTGTIHVLEALTQGSQDLLWLGQEGFNFERRAADRVEIYATDEEVERLAEAGFAFTETGQQTLSTTRSARARVRPGDYQDFESISAVLQRWAVEYSDRCRLTAIGKSVLNRELWAVKITTNPDAALGKPRVRLSAGLHGDEPLGTEICLRLIDLLLQGSQTNARLARIVESTEIWVLPLLNPDGLESNSRFNSGGYDLNRSFPQGGGGGLGNPLYGPLLSVVGRPPEVASIMRWSVERSFALAANFHAGALVVNYPYDDDELGATDSPSPDDNLFQAISLAYASNNPPMWASSDFPHGIVNGACWYVAPGTMQDWEYRYAGCNEVTIEISDIKRPPAASIDEYWEQNRESMLAYVETVQTGVGGWITDADTGQPLYAAVLPLGIEHPVLSDLQFGDYHRQLQPGTYHLRFSAPGHETRVVSNVVVAPQSRTRLDVALRPQPRPPERMIAVTCETLRTGLEAFKTRKTDQGFEVRDIVVPDGTAAPRIRAAIRDVFSAFPAEYIVLLGDVEQVPAFASGYLTDLPYALIDHGETADQYLGKDSILGRICLKTTNAMSEYARKLDVFARASTNRLRHLTWISQGSTIASDGHNWCISNCVAPTYSNTHFLSSQGPAAILTDRINAGTDGVVYSGHGNMTYWYWNHYDLAALAALRNLDHVPIVFGHCCRSAAFSADVCFAEGWLQTSGRGVAYVGATADTYWYEDDVMQRREFEAMGQTVGLSIGRAVDEGLLKVHQTYPDTAPCYYSIYHVLGDPTLVLLEAEVAPLEIVTPALLEPANSSIACTYPIQARGGLAPYVWRVSAGVLPDGLLLDPASGKIVGIPLGPGTNQFTILVRDASAAPQTASQTFTLVVRDLNEVYNQALDTPGWNWNYGGDALWLGQTQTSHDGTSAAVSGTITNQQQTWLETTITGPGILSFWWRASTTTNWDQLRCQLDAHYGAVLSGDSGWQRNALVIGDGQHVVRWTLVAGSSNAPGPAEAWLDQVEFTNSLAPIFLGHPASQRIVRSDPVTFSASAVGGGVVSYQWVRNGLPMLERNRSWFQLLNAQPADAGAYWLVASNAYGSAASACAWLEITDGLSLAEGLDWPGLVLQTGGENAPWVAQTTYTHDGADAVQTGPVDQYRMTDLTTTLAGPGRLEFWWRISSQDADNSLYLLTNDVAAGARISGNADWQHCAVELPPGLLTLAWEFCRSSKASGDSGWIDSLTFTPAPQPPFIVQCPVGLTTVLGGTASFYVDVTGPSPLSYQWLRDGRPLLAGTNAALVLSDVKAGDAGDYSVVVANLFGKAASVPAPLRVVRPDAVMTNTLVLREPVQIPRYGTAYPYPSMLDVRGLPGVVGRVSVTLDNLSHPSAKDLNVVLVAPSGRSVLLFGGVGTASPALDGVTITLDDDAPDCLPTEEQIVSGVFRPTAPFGGAFLEAPAPDGPYPTNLSAFAGSDPNGIWRLYIFDDDDGSDKGVGSSLVEGWSLSIATTQPLIRGPGIRNGAAAFTFQTLAGCRYFVESADSLAGAQWQPRQIIDGDGNTHEFTDSVPLVGTRFYRLRIE